MQRQLNSAQVLIFHNPVFQLIVTCDAYQVGVGVLIMHKMRRKTVQIQTIAFAYTEVFSNRKGLPLIFGVMKFHEYIISL